MATKGKFQGPKGTRDLYPEDMLRRRYIVQTWRDTAIRHGFEEIDGPTFETSELYAVKSGEGILGELFQAYSGKSPEEVERVQSTGRAPYATRPEFTPTGARMFAARAAQLNKPTRWFNIGPRFRAERPQRGRLREFLQFDCDVYGDDGTVEGRARADAEVACAAASSLDVLGLRGELAPAIHLNDRHFVSALLVDAGVDESRVSEALSLLDRKQKLPVDAYAEQGRGIGIDIESFEARLRAASEDGSDRPLFGVVSAIEARLPAGQSARVDPLLARGLAYYTGTVFEVIAEGERAVAGGGRYDNLIELLGGPPTPAVGFAMGDVVLSLLLEDKGLMPEGAALLEAVSLAPASVRPECFVISGGSSDDDGAAVMDRAVTRLVAGLRRGVESEGYRERGDAKPWDADRYSVRPMHARSSDKATKNLKKLLADAERQHARFAAVLHERGQGEPPTVQLKDLDSRKDLTPADVGVSDEAEFSVDPASRVYVGRAVASLLGR